jgi:hypothetical protein
VIALNEMNPFAVQTIAIRGDLLNATHAKVPEKIQSIVWLHALVHPIHDARVHLFRGCEWAIAVANDVEVPEVKVRREPGISHTIIMK